MACWGITAYDGHNFIVPLESMAHAKTQYSKELAFFLKRLRMVDEPVTANSTWINIDPKYFIFFGFKA